MKHENADTRASHMLQLNSFFCPNFFSVQKVSLSGLPLCPACIYTLLVSRCILISCLSVPYLTHLPAPLVPLLSVAPLPLQLAVLLVSRRPMWRPSKPASSPHIGIGDVLLLSCLNSRICYSSKIYLSL